MKPRTCNVKVVLVFKNNARRDQHNEIHFSCHIITYIEVLFCNVLPQLQPNNQHRNAIELKKKTYDQACNVHQHTYEIIFGQSIFFFVM